MPQRRLDPRDELAITTKVKTPKPNWSVTNPVQVGKPGWGRRGATRDRAIASAVEWRAARRFRSAHLIESTYSPLPYATLDKDQVIWRVNAL